MTAPAGEARTGLRRACLPGRTPWFGAVLFLAFMLAPAVAYGGPLGFAILPPAAAVLVMFGWLKRRRPHPVLLILGALWIWAAASYAWSPAAPSTARDYGDLESLTALKLAFVLMTGGVFAAAAGELSGPAARRALLAMAVVFAVYAVLVTIEPVTGAPLYHWFTRTLAEPVRPDMALIHLGQGTVALALLGWPLALALKSAPRWGGAAAFLILLGGVIAPLFLGQHSATLALVAGGLVGAAAVRFGPTAIRVTGGLTALVLLAAPWAVLALDRAGGLGALKTITGASTDARLDIWRLVSTQVLEQPLRGWGLDASRLLPPPVSLHPHNAPLQIWYELGAHGAILAALVWWALFDLLARTARTDRLGAAAGVAAATAYLVIGALSFGVWQEWWLGLGALTAAVCAALLVQRRWERMARPPERAGLQAEELQPL